MILVPQVPLRCTGYRYVKILRDLVKLPAHTKKCYRHLRLVAGFVTDFCFPISVTSCGYHITSTSVKLTMLKRRFYNIPENVCMSLFKVKKLVAHSMYNGQALMGLIKSASLFIDCVECCGNFIEWGLGMFVYWPWNVKQSSPSQACIGWKGYLAAALCMI